MVSMDSWDAAGASTQMPMPAEVRQRLLEMSKEWANIGALPETLEQVEAYEQELSNLQFACAQGQAIPAQQMIEKQRQKLEDWIDGDSMYCYDSNEIDDLLERDLEITVGEDGDFNPVLP